MFRTTWDIESSYNKHSHGWFKNSVEGVIHMHQTRVEERPRKSDNINETCLKKHLTKVSKDGNCKSKVKLGQPTGDYVQQKVDC
jgi:hypothetical protein